MRNLTKSGIVGLIAATSALAPAAKAQTVELYYGPYAYGAGGEFTAVTDPNLFNVNYAASALVNATDANNNVVQGFETFCVQTGVDFTPYNWGNTTPYNFGVSMSSIGAPDNFPLSEGAAYLYYQFATGQLAGYDYTDAGTRVQDAGQLQSALWALQGGQSYGGFPTGTGDGTTGNTYYNDALNALGAGNINQAANSSDNYGVEILNLTVAGTDGAVDAQNQLVYTGGGATHHSERVPDVLTTAALLTLSLGWMAVFGFKTTEMQRVRVKK